MLKKAEIYIYIIYDLNNIFIKTVYHLSLVKRNLFYKSAYTIIIIISIRMCLVKVRMQL